MIDSLRIKNFKCLKDATFDLNKINIFSGYNGRGKSSVLQTLLLLNQSIRENDDLSLLKTEGNMVDLGAFMDLLNNDKDESITFTIEYSTERKGQTNRHVLDLTYAFSTSDEFAANVVSFLLDGEEQIVKFGSIGTATAEKDSSNTLAPAPASDWLNKLLKNIYYVSADRRGPVKYVEAHGTPRDFSVGSKGESTINVLSSYQKPISEIFDKRKDKREPYSLMEAASWWLNYLMSNGSGGIYVPEIEPEYRHNRTSAIRTIEFKDESASHKAINVGFGYSYILSVVVMALIAPPDSILILENPEAHLHPKAQSRLTDLLCLLTQNGVQVIIETHSEHIVNGVILRALEDEIAINPDDLGIYFFDYDFSITKIKMSPTGKIENWPSGFFDQAEYDNAKILKLGMIKSKK